MIRRKLKNLLILLLLILTVLVVLNSINHPIILKWISGTARLIGKPIDAMVYTNHQINYTIRVFRAEKYWNNDGKADNYLLNLSESDSLGMLKFININLNENWIGIPVSTSKKDYDFVFGYLFQSETGGHFIPIQNEIKGFGYDPNLSVNDRQIKFDTPPNELKFDSVRIELK